MFQLKVCDKINGLYSFRWKRVITYQVQVDTQPDAQSSADDSEKKRKNLDAGMHPDLAFVWNEAYQCSADWI